MRSLTKRPQETTGRNVALAERVMPMPRYHQIYVVLREKISSGEYRPGMLIRSEKELSSDFSVSRITVRRALDELAREGLVRREQGRGTFVASEHAAHVLTSSVDEQLTNALRMGRKTWIELLEYQTLSAPPLVKQALRLRSGAKVNKTVRIRHLSDEPLSHVTVYAPLRLAKLYDRPTLMTSTPIISLIREGGYKIAVAEQVIKATLADSMVAPALHVEIGSPLLKISRTYYGEKENGLLHVDALYRSDRYSLRVTLRDDRVTDNAFLTSLL